MPTDRLEKLLHFLSESPTEPFLLFAVAKEYEGQNLLDQALDYYNQLKATDPGYVGLYYHLGKLYEKLDQAPSAWKTYNEGMEVARAAGDQHALSELAGARLELGDEEDFE